ncbi:Os03g0605700 [Oryza sativa Japonica Group]|uniref:Os03g0605700 protein n=1 Tax=Oryza sativa subsp. japonica TaxID=39947 RepID=A0A0N7KHM4_ORYSJ|nr:Os03g0605700 [Oryza sativa Japonica Group]
MEPCHGSVRASPPGGRRDDPTPAPKLLREMQPALKPIERFRWSRAPIAAVHGGAGRRRRDRGRLRHAVLLSKDTTFVLKVVDMAIDRRRRRPPMAGKLGCTRRPRASRLVHGYITSPSSSPA